MPLAVVGETVAKVSEPRFDNSSILNNRLNNRGLSQQPNDGNRHRTGLNTELRHHLARVG